MLDLIPDIIDYIKEKPKESIIILSFSVLATAAFMMWFNSQRLENIISKHESVKAKFELEIEELKSKNAKLQLKLSEITSEKTVTIAKKPVNAKLPNKEMQHNDIYKIELFYHSSKKNIAKKIRELLNNSDYQVSLFEEIDRQETLWPDSNKILFHDSSFKSQAENIQLSLNKQLGISISLMECLDYNNINIKEISIYLPLTTE
ncbi:MAG: hypothetical protein GY795_03480 [Desulfobacterales bacterium]|nr:hypothetical protein [Desulfobacterales bacterium]